ncbi:MAG TPA: bifunctional hydroxymethylpyrimidine kinase/phosphomethylpyrimidine kinase [Solirubrobacteraceae bacterium]|jgi:hydroxymethylpyrimidine/phosphomethylpyrimidine kinase|nr:bifunctional hydroxymethylpyrimidine kinase/phosphomethylpyrimidine kinase [Solirubrobacteraceae bacterium]
MTTRGVITRVLSVAGSDSGGGAGIQADLKAFARCGVHGMTAVTAVTAQNTRGVISIHGVPPEVIVAQIEAVVRDIGVDAVKVGMLGSRAAVVAVAGAVDKLAAQRVPIVVDPVLVASTGTRLLGVDGLDALRELLLPLATVLTPNLPEARTLVESAGRRSTDAAEELDDAGLARALGSMGPAYVVLTGGHRVVASDLYWDGETVVEIPGERHPGGSAHGSGCTHSAVLAAELGRGRSVLEAARIARALTADAVGRGLGELGGGDGPVDVLGLTGPTDPGRADRLP